MSLHESMVRPEIRARQGETVLDNPDHLELHQSQLINTMRPKSKPQNVSTNYCEFIIKTHFLVFKSQKYVENWR